MGIDSTDQSGVLKPIALIMHQPALASHIAKAPPNAEPATASHRNVPSKTPSSNVKAKIPEQMTVNMPSLSLAAFPFSPILHSMFSTFQSADRRALNFM